jgi:hypothetical protein
MKNLINAIIETNALVYLGVACMALAAALLSL